MLLEVRGLSKRFGGLTAVDHVDFGVREGSITGIIGPNGAGKTTFFNLISLVHRPDGGRILFDGEDVTGRPTHEAARLGMTRTFQTTSLFTEGTVLENVMVGYRVRTRAGLWGALLRTPRERREQREAREAAMETLGFVGLEALAGRPVMEITQEQKKRTAFALALVSRPRLVLLDEPAAGINPDETAGLDELIRKMVADGVTVCLIEHKMQMVMGLCDRIMVLDHGARIAEGAPEEIRNDPAVIEAYLGGTGAAGT